MTTKQYATMALLAWLTFSAADAQAFYNPQTGRWLSRDPIGEDGDVCLYAFARNEAISRYDYIGHYSKATEVPIPGRPGHFNLVDNEPEIVISRCEILIIAGHRHLQPKALTVQKADKGCAYGQAYGCATGGGTFYDMDLGGTIHVPAISTPGIPGAPGKPKKMIDDKELVQLATAAFEAAKRTAVKICKRTKCCCKEVSIRTEMRFYPGEDTDFDYPERIETSCQLAALHEVVSCGR